MTKNSLQFATLQNYSEENFRRLTGVKRATFDAMLEILEAAHTLTAIFPNISYFCIY